MEDKTNKLIQAYDKNSDLIGLFRFLGNNCPEDHLQTVISEYFELYSTDEDNADLHLFRWGLERVYIEYDVTI